MEPAPSPDAALEGLITHAPDATQPPPPSTEPDAQESKEEDPSTPSESAASPGLFSFRRFFEQARQVDGSLRHAENTLQQSRQTLGDLWSALGTSFSSGTDSSEHAFQSLTTAYDSLVAELDTSREKVTRLELERDGLKSALNVKELECDGLDQLTRTNEAELHLLRTKTDMMVREIAICQRRSADHDMLVAGQREQIEAEKKRTAELREHLEKERARLTDEVNAVRAFEAHLILQSSQIQYADAIEPPPFRGSAGPTGATRSTISPALPVQAPPANEPMYSADTMQIALLYQRREAQARFDREVGTRDETIHTLSRTVETLRGELREVQQQASQSGSDPQLRDDCVRYRKERDALRRAVDQHRADMGGVEEELRVRTRQSDKLEAYARALEEEQRHLRFALEQAREAERNAVATRKKAEETLNELRRSPNIPVPATPALEIEEASLRTQLSQARTESAAHQAEVQQLQQELAHREGHIREQDRRLATAQEDRERVAQEVAEKMATITDKLDSVEQLSSAELKEEKAKHEAVRTRLLEKLDKVGHLLKMSVAEKSELAKDLRRAIQERELVEGHFRDVVPLWWDWICSHFTVKGSFGSLLEAWVQNDAASFEREGVNLTVYALPGAATEEPSLGRFFGREYRQCVGSNQLPVEVESSSSSPDPTPPSSPDSLVVGTPPPSSAPPASSPDVEVSTAPPSSPVKQSTKDRGSPAGSPPRKKPRKEDTFQSVESPQLPAEVVAAYNALVEARPWARPRPSFIPSAYLSDPLYLDLQASLESFWAHAAEAHWRRRYMINSRRNDYDSDPVKRYLVPVVGCLYRIVKRGKSAEAHPGDSGLLPFLCYPHTFWPVMLRYGVSISRMVSGQGLDATCEYLRTQGHTDWPVVPPLVTQKTTRPFLPPVFASVEFVSKSVRDFHAGHFDPGASVKPDKSDVLDAARELLAMAEHFVQNFGQSTDWAARYDFLVDPTSPPPGSQWSFGLSMPPGSLPTLAHSVCDSQVDDEEKED